MARTPSPSGSRRVGRPSGPTEHGAASRARILDAAAEVFAHLGYDKARMADVVETSGMTKGSVYFHFASKEALAVAVLTEKHAQWIERVHSSLETSAPGRQRLEALLPAMLSLHTDDPYAWAVSRLTQNLSELPETRSLATELTQRWVDVVAEVVREAVDVQGETTTVDPTEIALLLVGAFDGLKTTIQVLTDDPASVARKLESGGHLLLRMVCSAIEAS